MSELKETQRFNVELPVELNESLGDHIPWGMKNKIIEAILWKLAEDFGRHNSGAIIGDIIDGNFELRYKRISKIES